MKLLSINSDSKTIKGLKDGVLTAVQYGAPSTSAGVGNQCPDASDACIASCLFTAGRAAFDASINQARILRTIMFVRNKTEYWPKMVKELQALIRKATRLNLAPACRLNGTTDAPWERMRIRGTEFDGMTLMQAFPTIQFYDYTKTIKRLGTTPDNYYLLASKSERMSDATMAEIIANGHNVAVVFRVCDHRGNCKCPLPTSYLGHAVVNGDLNDLRYKDPAGVIVALKAKGRAKNDTAGFVIDVRYWWTQSTAA